MLRFKKDMGNTTEPTITNVILGYVGSQHIERNYDTWLAIWYSLREPPPPPPRRKRPIKR